MRLALVCFYCLCVFVYVLYFIATMSFAGYFLPVLFCMLSMLISDSRLIWFGSVYLVTTAGFVADQLMWENNNNNNNNWGMLRRSRRVQLFLSKNSTGTICIAWLHLQEGHFIFICFAPLHVHPCPCNVRISTEYLYSEHALKVRWMHSYPTAGKINPNHAPKSLCCCSTVQERLRSVWFVLTAVVYQQYKHSYM